MAHRLVATLLWSLPEPKVHHYWGLPPELAGESDNREEMAQAAPLVIEDTRDGAFLYRFSADGAEAGDTWHETVDDAKQQAEFEYDGAVSQWREVPDDVDDIVAFGLGGTDGG